MRSTASPFLPRVLALSLACAAAGGAVAQAAAALPAMKAQGAVRYLCGGIGSDESTALRAAMRSHPLSLLFARASGDYLADVQVDIADTAGRSVLSIRADGPVCLLDLPSGSYTVQAGSGGVTKQERIRIGTVPSTLDFRF